MSKFDDALEVTERRRAPRAAAIMPLAIRVADLDDCLHGQVVNISQSGAFVLTDDPPPVGTRLEIEVTLDSGDLVLHATAEVVRQQTRFSPFGVGLKLVEVAYESQALIDRMVADQRLFGDFRLEKLIGQGGMAEVYRARILAGENMGKTVALKRLHSRLSEDPMAADLFRREAELTRTLHHPNIIEVVQTGSINDRLYIAMDYIDGVNLDQLLTACRRRDIFMPIDFCCFVIHTVARALHAAHRATDGHGNLLGIVHRDVAPGNVFISERGEIKLGDFGVAHVASVGSAKDLVAGRDVYIAPEQLQGKGVTPASDVFALGAVFYEMLTNKIAFTTESRRATFRRIIAGEVVPPSRLRPEISAELANVVLTAISPRTGDESLLDKTFGSIRRFPVRFKDANAFAEAIAPLYDPAIGTQLAISHVVHSLFR